MTATLSPVPTELEVRLARLERAVQPIEALAQQAPLMLATLTEMADAMAARMGDFDDRTRALGEVAERATRPETLATVHKMLDLVESAPALTATATDMVDEAMRRLAESGVPIEHLVEIGASFVHGLVNLATSPEVRNLLESGMLEKDAVATLGRAADAISGAARAPADRVGVIGALKALNDPDVQRAMGFLVDVAQRFGRAQA